MFAHMLGALTRLTDAAFAPYGVTAEELAAMRGRFAEWRADLLPEPG